MNVKTLTLALAAALLLPVGAGAADAPPADGAGSMLLYHAASDTVLAEHDGDETRLIASTTKLMTALVAAEQAPPETEVLIQKDWLGAEGSSMYLRAGETYTLEELLCGLLLASGNDAATAIACHISGSVEAFSTLMNERAAALGMTKSQFKNPHGLDVDGHFSTARDLARLMAAVMENDVLRELVGTRSRAVKGVNYVNHNKLLWRCSGCIGGKTGFTKAAGRCLVSVCEREGLELICVTLGDPSDWRDHAALYDWAYGRFECFSLLAGEALAAVPVISGSVETVGAAPLEDVVLCLPKGTPVETRCALPRFVFAPLRRGDQAGSAALYANGALLLEQKLVWTESAARLDERRRTVGVGIYSI